MIMGQNSKQILSHLVGLVELLGGGQDVGDAVKDLGRRIYRLADLQLMNEV